MNAHTPTADNQIYTCPRCTFRAVQTTRGLFVLDSGDGKQQHLDAIAAERQVRREWVYAVVTRLRGMHGGDIVLNPRQRDRLVRYVMMEYEG